MKYILGTTLIIYFIYLIYLIKRDWRRDWMPDIKDINPRYDVNVDCGHECHYVPGYGFVPECGCPVHDAEDIVVEVLYENNRQRND